MMGEHAGGHALPACYLAERARVKAHTVRETLQQGGLASAGCGPGGVLARGQCERERSSETRDHGELAKRGAAVLVAHGHGHRGGGATRGRNERRACAMVAKWSGP